MKSRSLFIKRPGGLRDGSWPEDLDLNPVICKEGFSQPESEDFSGGALAVTALNLHVEEGRLRY